MRRSFIKNCLGIAFSAGLPGTLALRHGIAGATLKYPDRPIRLVVTFGAGGLADVVARLVATNLSQELGQSVVVENRAGASGAIGAQAVARAAPDGYVLMSGTPSTQIINKLIYKDLSYDPRRDFIPVSLLGETPLVVTVTPKLKVNSLAELVEYAKANPDKLTYASAGVGTSPHLAMEMLKLVTGTQILHIPYKGGGEAANAAIAGQVDVFVEALPVVGPHITGGTLRALAVPRKTRLAALPNIPTAAEAGFPEYVVPSPWSGVIAPAGTPAGILSILEQALTKTLSDTELRQNLKNRGVLVAEPGPKPYQALLDQEWALWSNVVKKANITAG